MPAEDTSTSPASPGIAKSRSPRLAENRDARFPSRSGSYRKTRTSTCCRCKGRIHSGTKTYSRARRFGSMREAQRLNFRPFLSVMPNGSHRWLKNSATSTEPTTLGSTIPSSTLSFSFRCAEGAPS